MRSAGDGGGEEAAIVRNKRERDRASEAFRRWARAGCPGFDQIRDVKGSEDLRACAAVFDAAGELIRRAVREVYMEEPRRPMRRAEVTMRVRRVGFECGVDERTVYRWLGAARKMWAVFRR